jgi:hypothetical protein
LDFSYFSFDEDHMKRCKCGEMIDFVKMASGKKMPVEILNPLRVAVVVQESIIPGDEIYKITSGLIPHWIKCPYARKFRKHESKKS